MFMTFLSDLVLATGETLYMVLMSTLFAVLLGLPLGTWLFVSEKIKPSPRLYKVLSAIINISRSIPFIILLVALIPFTRFLVGSSIGLHAAIVPLTLGATPFFARLIANLYQNLSPGLIETGFSFGASSWQLIKDILFPEAFPGFIQAITLTAITLVNYSAMAGTVGGGGLGDLAIRYGYQRFNPWIMLATVVILIIMVQGIQSLGDRLTKHYQ